MGAGIWERHGMVVDTTYWPVLIEKMPVDAPNDPAAIETWIAHVDVVLRERASHFVMVVDTLATRSVPDAHVRKRMAEWLSESWGYQTYCLGTVFIVASPIVRGALTAIHWITRPRPPRVIVGSWPEALTEARTSFAPVNLSPPLGLEHYVSRGA